MAKTYSYTKENYTRKGRKNRTVNKEFVRICKMSQKELKKHLYRWLFDTAKYSEVVFGDGFVYAKGDIPVLVTAHMDTVHKQNVKEFYEYTTRGGRHIVSSPQGIGGDDRCGVYMIKQIIKSGLKPYVLFCEDEEIGGVGSNKFIKTPYINDLKEMLFLIELDRANRDDVVYYEDGNDEFHKFVEKATGYKENYGSFSDISHLSPACDVSSVNISCGYYNAHTTDEYVVLEEMEYSIKRTIALIKHGVEDGKQYEYEEIMYSYSSPHYASLYGFGPYKGYDSYLEREKEKNEPIKTTYYFVDYDGNEYIGIGANLEEAAGFMFINNPTLSFSDIWDILDYNDVLEREAMNW